MNEFVAALDAHLLRAGNDITLRRVTGSAPGVSNVDVTVRAAVRSYQPQELVGGIAQTDSLAIISPTQIAALPWPGNGEVASATVADPALPRRNDKLVIAGRVRNIEAVMPIYLDGVLVRIELRVNG
jgi:hypothetical protein